VRYHVLKPSGAAAPTRNMGSALTPGLTRPASGWSSRGPVVGNPGTLRVPAAAPAAVRAETTATAAMGNQGGSVRAPQYWLPSLYRLAGKQECAPVSRVSDNQMPIPAVRPTNVIPSNPYVSRKGGQRQVIQPQVVQTWLGMRGTNGG
jgi:hypothetical protein